jgi:hypothetical protein
MRELNTTESQTALEDEIAAAERGGTGRPLYRKLTAVCELALKSDST